MPASYQAFIRPRSKAPDAPPTADGYEVQIVEAAPTPSFAKEVRARPSSLVNGAFGLLPGKPRTLLVVVKLKGVAVAGAVATPRWFRFPFMESNDLQLGDVWTNEAHRRQGLALSGCTALIAAAAAESGSIWWISESTNQPSIDLARRLGFEPHGPVRRTRRLGTTKLGSYVLTP